MIWANTVHSGSDPMQLFNATAEAQTAPDVNFNLGPATATGPAPGGGAPAVAPGSPPPAQ